MPTLFLYIQNLQDSQKTLRQHLVDMFSDQSLCVSHCKHHALYPGSSFQCEHDHHLCEVCEKPFEAMFFIQNVLKEVKNAKQQEVFESELDEHFKDILNFMAHVVCAEVQQPMQDETIAGMVLICFGLFMNNRKLELL